MASKPLRMQSGGTVDTRLSFWCTDPRPEIYANGLMMKRGRHVTAAIQQATNASSRAVRVGNGSLGVAVKL